MRGATAALLLFLPCLLLPPHAAAAGVGSSCVRRCGGLTVRYPFGFSAGCETQLGFCDPADGTAWIGHRRELGLRLRNVTERALVVELRPDCTRRLDDSLQALFFSGTYAPSTRNALVVSSCNATAAEAARAPTNCSIPPGNGNSSHCSSAAANSIRCVPPPPPPPNNASVVHHFLNRNEMLELGKECTGLVSAVSYSPSPAPAFFLGALELEWWVLGPCRCSPHANCTSLTTPTEEQAFRCECLEGFEGDGFADGAGCRRGQYNTASDPPPPPSLRVL
jgi:hypothetical protein